eukprot:2636364-Ditylum_brightwellii.AAC.2
MRIDGLGILGSLVGGGHHFCDAPHNRRTMHIDLNDMPMDKMIQLVKDKNLIRPRGRTRK